MVYNPEEILRTIFYLKHCTDHPVILEYLEKQEQEVENDLRYTLARDTR